MMNSSGLPMIIQGLDVPASFFILALIILAVWSLFWKGWALWTAARRSEKVWFIVFLLVNTVGILEIIYLFALNKREKGGEN